MPVPEPFTLQPKQHRIYFTHPLTIITFNHYHIILNIHYRHLIGKREVGDLYINNTGVEQIDSGHKGNVDYATEIDLSGGVPSILNFYVLLI